MAQDANGSEKVTAPPGPIGAALVAGGGIGGMQAALDLAESGYRVYLVEEKPAVGGRMAQLDKTFPTNDCAMCVISPKLVEVGRHRNITLLTNTDVVGLDGEPGRYAVRLRRRPRFVDVSKCTACGECAKACPVSAPNPFDLGLSQRKAVFKLYPQATPNAYGIDRQGRSPCALACPAGTRVQGYVALTTAGKFQAAIDLIRKVLPFPSVCGRVCHHPCEQECNRGDVDKPVAIREIKRFLADRAVASGEPMPTPPPGEPKGTVAVVGSGPAGLTAADDLAGLGYKVTVFEAAAEAGGMMLGAIPRFRLPAEPIRADIRRILARGVEVRTGVRVGTDVTLQGLHDQGFGAAILAVGAGKSRGLPIPGKDLGGVLLGLDFLLDVNRGQDVRVGKRVVVVGGGNVAIDVAQTALRQGAEDVAMVCLESSEEMPAHSWAREEATEEEIRIVHRWGPMEIEGRDGRAAGIKFKRCTRVFDERRAFRPEFDERETMRLDADTVILAIGQAVDDGAAKGLDGVARNGKFLADPLTLQTGVPWVFAAGDAVRGPASVIEAVQQGHEAAESVDRFLRGADLRAGRPAAKPEAAPLPAGDHAAAERIPTARLKPGERRRSFAEIESVFTEEQAVAEARRCLGCAGCSECFSCVEACLPGAMLHDQKAEDLSVEVGAIVLAPGFEQFDPVLKGEFGHGRYANVVSSLQMERMLSASGPTQGHLKRPSDGADPKRIAWIQCVGSREPAGKNEYCSSVCCMFAAKEAVIAREHDPEIKPTIFFMDVRAHGKEFDAYYERAQKERGVRLVRSMVSRVLERPSTKNLELTWVGEEGALRTEEFDLVVLSAGMEPGAGAKRLAEALAVDLNAYGFCRTTSFEPLQAARPGVFVCGAFQGPKDIPETVSQASGAAGQAGTLLAPARGSLVSERVFPPEADVAGQEPRVGVFVCRCGINIAGVVDVPSVAEFAKSIPGVVHVEENLFTCSQDTQVRIAQRIREHRLNRVVVASCSPRTHEPLFRETIRDSGLNPFYFEMANIRDQCSWVHGNDKPAATAKAKSLVRMAAAKAALDQALHMTDVEVVPRALVVGGGLAGITAALGFAGQGFETYLVEREDRLGGNLRHIRYLLDGSDPQAHLKGLLERLEREPLVRVYTGAEVVDFTGHVGHFVTGIRRGEGGERIELVHGVAVVATGAEEIRPAEYLYGQDPRVLTQRELEERIERGEVKPGTLKSVVMIQCVGSRDEERPYCSRVCCSVAVKNALRIRKDHPAAAVTVLYRDMRTYGFLEKYYHEARKAGVLFLRYEPGDKPRVEAGDGALRVRVRDLVLKRDLRLSPDLVVLSAGMQPRGNERLATALKVPLTASKFFLEAHMKLRPVDFASDGIFLCGLAHAPKNIPETVAQAYAAVSRGCTVLSKKKLSVGGIVSVVDADRCVACLTCVRACPYGVPEITADRVARIEVARCHGCGICASECPRKAIALEHYRDEQVLAKVGAQFE